MCDVAIGAAFTEYEMRPRFDWSIEGLAVRCDHGYCHSRQLGLKALVDVPSNDTVTRPGQKEL